MGGDGYILSAKARHATIRRKDRKPQTSDIILGTLGNGFDAKASKLGWRELRGWVSRAMVARVYRRAARTVRIRRQGRELGSRAQSR